MTQLMLQCNAETTNGPCGVCGRPVAAPAGTRLVEPATASPVCPDCGKKHAPSLAALANLADAAARVGRIGRHSVFPPLTALLDLASAAEKYSSASPAAPAAG